MDYTMQFSVTGPAQTLPVFSEQDICDGINLLKQVQHGDTCYIDVLGWHDPSIWASEAWLDKYSQLAGEIRRKADAFVVVGIGGSNQAARAVITALRGKTDGPAIFWAGNTISAYETEELLQQLDGYRNIYINVIAKNFETLEPGIAFRTLRSLLQKQHPANWPSHIIATGTEGSHLHALCQEHGFTFLPFPMEIGGRFTALCPVGLFPMAVAGLDITQISRGAADMEHQLKSDQTADNPALRYAMLRNALYQAGYRMEMLSFFEPRMVRFSKWWIQLFGESEGKDGLGLYPISGNYSEDLHSIGQFVQDGTRVIFETFLTFRTQDDSLYPSADSVDDRFQYLNGLNFEQINHAAYEATVAAHSEVLPCITLSFPEINEYVFGQLFYFFEFSCYLSGRMLGVNPFNQPGVEAYKKHMFQILGK